MARTKEFDRTQALDDAIQVFREHGFEGTSTEMLVRAMKIGRQSLYDTFGDKWKLYCLAVERYAAAETDAHIAMLHGAPRARDGIREMMERVAENASQPCLGVSSICEFGQSRPDLTAIHQVADRRLKHAAKQRISEAQADGDLNATLSTGEAANFLFANIAGIRIAARGGADPGALNSLAHLALQALT